MPWRCSVNAVVTMMKNITMFEKNVPATTSSLRVMSSRSVAPRRAIVVVRPMNFSSSTSCDACQKKRYGLIVVPRMATRVDQASLPRGRLGTIVSRTIDSQFGRTTIAVRTYANRKSASHFRVFAIFAYGSQTVAALIAIPNTTT